MIVPVLGLLTAEHLDRARALLDGIEFEDGSATAGWHARAVKHIEQAKPAQPAADEARKIILEAVQRNQTVVSAALPHRISPLLISRYTEGMEYGKHVDDAIRPGNPPMRCDISFTVFLSDPESYEGGALVTAALAGEQTIRLPAGGIVLYPSTTLHRVAPVTAGVRMAAVGWIQSLVRQPAHREILFDLDEGRRQVFGDKGKTQLFDTLSKTYSNLLRMWADV